MSTTHTPGPWIIEKSDGVTRGHWIHDEAKEFVALAVMRHSSREEETSNARLIAATPDLLEMLQIIVANARVIPDPDMHGHTDIYSVPICDIESAREAIRKATTP